MSVIDEYLKDLPPGQKAELERVRQIVLRMVPEAEEVISYGMPTFKFKKKYIIHFGAFKNHMSVFPTGDPAVAAIEGAEKFQTSKGTLQFTEGSPIPEQLIKQIVQVRLDGIDKK